MKCTLPADINSCEYFIPEGNHCRNENKCSFQDIPTQSGEKYIRQERWYEKYYKKR